MLSRIKKTCNSLGLKTPLFSLRSNAQSRINVKLSRHGASNGRHQMMKNSCLLSAKKGSDTWNSEAWYGAYLDVEETPNGYWITEIEGKLPAQLEGTYFRNGPGRMHNSLEHAHPYDADGLVVSVALRDGKAFFRSSFVTTDEYYAALLSSKCYKQRARYLAEVDAGRVLFNGAFGTIATTEERQLIQIHSRNASNTNVMLWKNKLWALYECSQPYAMDPYTLHTVGLVDNVHWISTGEPFDSTLGPNVNKFLSNVIKRINDRAILHGLGGCGVTVHPKYDPVQHTTIAYTYCLKLNNRQEHLETSLQIYEFDDNFKQKSQVEYTIPNFAFLHEIAFTSNYYIIIESIAVKNPVSFDVWRYVSGQESAVSSVKWKELSPSKIHLVPRALGSQKPLSKSRDDKKTRIIEIPPSFIFHIANSYEEDDYLVLDSIHYKQFPKLASAYNSDFSFRDIQPEKQPISRLKRMICDLSGKQEVVINEISLRAMEFPVIHPSYEGLPYRFVYSLAGLHQYKNGPPQAIAKTEINTGETVLWSPGIDYFAGEPVFVPKPNTGVSSLAEDDGWLLSLCYSGKTKKSEIVILDAKGIENGPIAVLKLKGALPHGLHGIWSPNYFGP